MTISVLSAIQPEDTGKGLVPKAFTKLPIGAIAPKGWLKRQLDIELQGIPGQLWKTSPYLAEGNGWLEPQQIFSLEQWFSPRPWEEQPYWLRTYVKLAILAQDKEALARSQRYMDAMMNSREPDGWFGPQNLKHFHSEDPESKAEVIDLWPHMVVLEAIMSWYEYTKAPKYLELVHGFLRFCNSLPDDQLIPRVSPEDKFPWLVAVQRSRAGDMLPVINDVIELTGDEELVALAHKLFRKCSAPSTEFLAVHTVNFTQRLSYAPVYSRISRQPWHRTSADYWYQQHMAVWGTLPRGAFCADEHVRAGCTDPRYATESCSWAEFTRSFNYIGELNAEPVWADRTEDILFNHYPAAYTEDMKGLHYLTACNQVMLDDYLTHNVANKAQMFAYSAKSNRCCLHNAGLGWPLFMEYLMTRVWDGGVCAWLHGDYEAHLAVGKEQHAITWTSRTDYPFRDEILFTLKTEGPVDFPFYIRIPRWCKSPSLWVNDEAVPLPEAGGKLVKIDRTWKDGDRVRLKLPAEITLARNPRNGGVTVDRGPFSYSLQIPEKRQEVVSKLKEGVFKKEIWDEATPQKGSRWLEVLPDAPWNYGLMPEKGFEYEEHPLPEDYVFLWNQAPMTIRATGKKIPAWKLQDHMCAPLQNSPVKSTEPEEPVTLIPLGCARLRLSVFPEIGDTAAANEWQDVPEFTDVESRPKIRT